MAFTHRAGHQILARPGVAADHHQVRGRRTCPNPLFKAIRAHGNAAENVPTLIVLFLLVGARSPAAVAIPLIAGATAARLVHAYAMLAVAAAVSLL